MCINIETCQYNQTDGLKKSVGQWQYDLKDYLSCYSEKMFIFANESRRLVFRTY